MSGGMDAPTMATLRLMAIAMAHEWAVTLGEQLAQRDMRHDTHFFVRMNDLRWGVGLLEGRHIKVTIHVEPYGSGGIK